MDFILKCGIPFLIIASYGLLAAQPDLRLCIPLLVAVTAAVTVLLAAALHAGERGSIRWGSRTVLLVAVLVRLLFLFRPAELSNDIYRYLWDGMQFLAGCSPYASAPSEVQPPSEAMAHLLGQINHPQLATVYPPAAQLIFAAGAAAGNGVPGLKALLTAIDLAVCCLILRLLADLGLPALRAVLYAWHPLPILEIAGSGHIDGAAVFFLLLAFLFLASYCDGERRSAPEGGSAPLPKRRPLLPCACGLAFACAVLVKLFPLVFLPCIAAFLDRRARISFLCGFLAGGICLTVPFLPDVSNGVRTLGIYARDWEFSGFLYQALIGASLTGIAARAVLSLLFILAVLFSCGIPFGNVKEARARNAGNLLFRSGWSRGPYQEETAQEERFLAMLRRCYGISLAFVLLTPTLFPWYALYLAGLLPFAAGPCGLVISWSVFLSYRVFIPYTLLGVWAEDAGTSAAIWLAPVAAFVASLLAGMLTRRNAAPAKDREFSAPEDSTGL